MFEPVEHLYIHLPFCAKICPYCAFYVEVGGASRQAEMVEALRIEWEHLQREFPIQLKTLFIGGGTPSLLKPEVFARLMEVFPVLPAGGEMTLEVNPATVTPAKILAWKAGGVNRVSLGAQSFDGPLLKLLGRQHDPQDIPETCTLLRGGGFENLSLDLMFALPGQTLDQWDVTLQAALDCRPQHISAYALTYELDTPFFEQLGLGTYRRNEELEIAMFERTRLRLGDEGFAEYEISNFASPGFESIHNRGYWKGSAYLGIGPSAVSTVNFTPQHSPFRARRWKNIADSQAYVQALQRGVPAAEIRCEHEDLSASTWRTERILLGLRTREGIHEDLVKDKLEQLAHLEKQGFLEQVNDRWTLTSQGKLVADSLAAELG